MKYSSLLIVALSLLVLGAACGKQSATTKTDSTTQWEQYHSTTDGFTIQYPAGYTVEYFSPNYYINKLGVTEANIMIDVYNPTMNIEQWITDSFGSVPGRKITRTPVTVNGIAGYYLQAEHPSESALYYVLPTDRHVFQITIQTDKKRPSSLEKYFEAVATSFTLD